MKSTESQQDLSLLIADLNDESALEQVANRIKSGDDPLLLMEECQKGIRIVGERYEKGEYFLSALIMAGEIMHEAGEMILPLIKSNVSGNETGRVLIGTVEGDIHYIGKDIVKVMLGCYGFTAFDIGVDVKPVDFLSKAKEIKPHIIGLSCLINSSYSAMRDTIQLLRTKCDPPPSFIIGGLVDQKISEFVNADAWANDAIVGIRQCQQLIKKHDTSH